MNDSECCGLTSKVAWRSQLYEVSILCRVHWGRRDSTLSMTSSSWLFSLILAPRPMMTPAPAEAAFMDLCSAASAFLLCAGVKEYSLSSTPNGTRTARVINLHCVNQASHCERQTRLPGTQLGPNYIRSSLHHQIQYACAIRSNRVHRKNNSPWPAAQYVTSLPPLAKLDLELTS